MAKNKKEVNENNESKSIEERFTEIEDLIKKMDSEDVSLEESFELYKKGLDEVKESYNILQSMEGEILKLTEDGELEEL
ncbi:exodeoxyribonuclease VII small subunit [Lachnobacterium bovis]|uniref:Exodeoxyribonuclease 7 small subunit n=1 Tax=Lachnobacterium bovis TaxID=140626 RepID=A0A1H9PTZ3_9FIRM|nr:exodeoxyribonuclease VII small subunit [Lachnobacterium bovis]SER51652.1 Exodeoxyribonuclease VII small subunit [Lachnobacterium bovis]